MYMVYMRAAAEQYNYKMYIQTAQYLFGCSYNYKQYTGLFYGDERCPGSSRHEFPPLVRGSSVQDGDYK